MQLTTLTATAILAALPAFAIPTPKARSGSTIAWCSSTNSTRTITTYAAGPAHKPPRASGLEKRCGTNKAECDGSNVPANNTCQDLISSIHNYDRVLATARAASASAATARSAASSGPRTSAASPRSTSGALDQCVSEGKSPKVSDVTINGSERLPHAHLPVGLSLAFY